MADGTRDPRMIVDPAIDSPGREGLTGTAPASLYVPGVRREHVTVAPDGSPPEVQPAWRQDFPVDWPQDQYVERRDFLKFMVLTSGAFTVGQLWIAAQNWYRRRAGQPPIVRIAAIDSVPVGGSVAFNQKCTHLSCAVIPRPQEGSFYCPCHEGRFDLTTGAPIAGPPRRPLTRILLERRGSEIYAVGTEARTI